MSSAISLAAVIAIAPSEADTAADRTKGAITDHNPLGGYEGYCTWGAQEQIHLHTGYYVAALTGNAEDWANQAQRAGWTVVDEPAPRSIAVYSRAIVGGVGHVAWVETVDGVGVTITEMNFGVGATAANGFRGSGFHIFDTRTVRDITGVRYILIP
ncbi:CHAP domain-containing protein [Mycobacterium vicinigordonae]|uniref:CHAP domain-containing protein n=1 Tax=Mycobacterium vicinigordonae TaxID=1719132 RepID=A0A7D6E1N4_9MYCO|nr:CHAP domain-containing protein [Mycobacterium vicinigordonae]QLL08770.1 CHAP domain-containing protein [Mycobacterium vicinigordonae]